MRTPEYLKAYREGRPLSIRQRMLVARYLARIRLPSQETQARRQEWNRL